MHPNASAQPAGPGLRLSQDPAPARARVHAQGLAPAASGCSTLRLARSAQHPPFPSDSVAVWGGQFDSCLPFFSEMPNSLKVTNRQIGGLCLRVPLGQWERLSWMLLPKLLFQWHLSVHKQELRKVAWHFLILEIQGTLWGT